MPQLGFGVYKIPEDAVGAAIGAALEVGYRSIDTAALYGNEVGVGQALAAAQIPREELFLTTKVWNTEHGHDATLRAFDASMERLASGAGGYVDLYLIHWPVPAEDLYVDTWRALLQLRAEGRVKAVGVCNFAPAHLQRLIDETGEAPAINQVELNPTFQQAQVRAFNTAHGVVTEAWAPLARAGALFADPVITSIAAKHARTAAQVVLRWHLQLGNVVIPKSVTPSRIAENFDVWDFELDAADLVAIARLEAGERQGPDPDTFGA